MFSETSSFASSTAGSTRSSGGSGITTSSKQSRKRAKEQNKRKQRLTGKEGNPREEEYLVMTLKEMVPSAKYQRTITVHLYSSGTSRYAHCSATHSSALS